MMGNLPDRLPSAERLRDQSYVTDRNGLGSPDLVALAGSSGTGLRARDDKSDPDQKKFQLFCKVSLILR